jgi:hypothetical protein
MPQTSFDREKGASSGIPPAVIVEIEAAPAGKLGKLLLPNAGFQGRWRPKSCRKPFISK